LRRLSDPLILSAGVHCAVPGANCALEADHPIINAAKRYVAVTNVIGGGVRVYQRLTQLLHNG